jgi:beta-lactamase regulating signal transducer with metallopeptidase domain
MASELLNVLENATVASSCGILLTLLLRRQLRTFFGPSLAYLLWLLVPTSFLVLLLPALVDDNYLDRMTTTILAG